jgi:hypothetical protein
MTMFGQTTLTLTGPATARPGDVISVNMTLVNVSQDLAALQWTAVPPSGYVTSVVAGAASNAVAKTLYCGLPASNICLTVGINNTTYTQGVVAIYSLTVPATALPGTVAFPLSGTMGATLVGNASLVAPGTPYMFSVLAAVTDLNGDGRTDMADLQIAIQGILSGTGGHTLVEAQKIARVIAGI